jgi:hypothetical protein
VANVSQININSYDNHLLITGVDQSNLIDHVPAMVYRARMTREGLVLIKDRPNFTLPQLRFGKHNRYFSAICAEYDPLGSSTGVLLAGHKGSGKSLMAEELGNWMIKRDLPVIMIDDDLCHHTINLIIRAVGPCMVLFDEFGKVYSDEDKRNRLLTVFSDTSYVGVMFVITGNCREEFGEFLVNRPQRFRFAIHYESGVDVELACDVLKKMQVREEMHETLLAYVQGQQIQHGGLNIDSFLAVVRASANCKTVAELEEVTEIMNVPRMVKKEWRVISVVATPKHELAEDFGYSADITKSFVIDGNPLMLSIAENRNTGRSWEKDEEGCYITKSFDPSEDFSDVVINHEGQYYDFEIIVSYCYSVNAQGKPTSKRGKDHPRMAEMESLHAQRNGNSRTAMFGMEYTPSAFLAAKHQQG